MVTAEQVNKIKEAYESNKRDLEFLKQFIKENDDSTDINDTFEMGYNNALEYVFEILGIKDYKR